MLELIYHATVRHVRKSQGNAILGLLRKSFREMREGAFGKDGPEPRENLQTPEVATEK